MKCAGAFEEIMRGDVARLAESMDAMRRAGLDARTMVVLADAQRMQDDAKTYQLATEMRGLLDDLRRGIGEEEFERLMHQARLEERLFEAGVCTGEPQSTGDDGRTSDEVYITLSEEQMSQLVQEISQVIKAAEGRRRDSQREGGTPCPLTEEQLHQSVQLVRSVLQADVPSGQVDTPDQSDAGPPPGSAGNGEPLKSRRIGDRWTPEQDEEVLRLVEARLEKLGGRRGDGWSAVSDVAQELCVSASTVKARCAAARKTRTQALKTRRISHR